MLETLDSIMSDWFQPTTARATMTAGRMMMKGHGAIFMATKSFMVLGAWCLGVVLLVLVVVITLVTVVLSQIMTQSSRGLAWLHVDCLELFRKQDPSLEMARYSRVPFLVVPVSSTRSPLDRSCWFLNRPVSTIVSVLCALVLRGVFFVCAFCFVWWWCLACRSVMESDWQHLRRVVNNEREKREKREKRERKFNPPKQSVDGRMVSSQTTSPYFPCIFAVLRRSHLCGVRTKREKQAPKTGLDTMTTWNRFDWSRFPFVHQHFSTMTQNRNCRAARFQRIHWLENEAICTHAHTCMHACMYPLMHSSTCSPIPGRDMLPTNKTR